ncbi:MAG: hypothetical protein ABIL49_03540 [candidate division WOR-3 bacterium]|jgi:hypothetical protein
MIFLIFVNVDSVYNYLVKSLKLNPKTTSYKVDTIGLNFYSVLIRSYDKKIKETSKIEKALEKLGLLKTDTLFSGKLLSNEINDLKINIKSDTLFISFKLRILPKEVVFDEKKLENYIILSVENATNVKIDKKRIERKLETKSDFYNFRIVLRGEKNSKFSQDDITKIKNYLLRDNIYAMDYQIGKLVYVKFSGLIENYVVYDSYIKYLEDSLLVEMRIKKPELKTVKIAVEILKILKSISKDKVVGYGINSLEQDLVDNKIVNVIKVDMIIRKDVDFESLKNSIVDEGSKISQNNNAYVVSGVIVISNPVLRSELYKTLRLEFGQFSDYDMFKLGSINIEVQ